MNWLNNMMETKQIRLIFKMKIKTCKSWESDCWTLGIELCEAVQLNGTWFYSKRFSLCLLFISFDFYFKKEKI